MQKGFNMKKYKEIKKEILALIDLYLSENRMNLEAEITQDDNEFKINIYEKIPSHHHFFANPILKVKSIPKDEFLTLNTSKIQKLIIDLFDEYEEYPHPGPGLNQ